MQVTSRYQLDKYPDKEKIADMKLFVRKRI
jgi:hypothetical protein